MIMLCTGRPSERPLLANQPNKPAPLTISPTKKIECISLPFLFELFLSIRSEPVVDDFDAELRGRVCDGHSGELCARYQPSVSYRAPRMRHQVNEPPRQMLQQAAGGASCDASPLASCPHRYRNDELRAASSKHHRRPPRQCRAPQ
jgi:hypothetical protein